jgi:uncharacterized protein (TIGR03067 family)
MLTEPREALPRSSTFIVRPERRTWIDLTTAVHGKQPLYTKAIFELHGDHLTYCVAAPDLPRPAAFETSKGDGRTLVVLKRVTAG